MTGAERIPAITGLLDKRIVFVTGKGGAGKSTVAYALGLASAARGERTIVCEIAGRERGAALFGHDPGGFTEVELAENLWTISIDPDEMVKEYLAIKLPIRAMASVLTAGGLFGYLAAATPGLAEMVTLGKIWELAQDERRAPGADGSYRRVIVDAPASGHAVALLRTPETFREIARAGPLAKQAGLIEAAVADPRQTGMAVVATPEETAVTEAGEIIERLRTRLSIDLIVCNGLLPERFAEEDLARIEATSKEIDLKADLAVALRAALREGARAASRREELRRLRGLGREVPLVELQETSPRGRAGPNRPGDADGGLGERELRLLAGALAEACG